MDKTALVAQGTVRANQHVVGNGLSEHLHLEHIGNDFLCLTVDIGVAQRNIVVAGNHVAQSRQTLLHTLNRHRVGERVSQVLQLLVGGGRGHKETVAVADTETSNDASAGNAGVDDRDHITELGLEDTIILYKKSR